MGLDFNKLRVLAKKCYPEAALFRSNDGTHVLAKIMDKKPNEMKVTYYGTDVLPKAYDILDENNKVIRYKLMKY